MLRYLEERDGLSIDEAAMVASCLAALTGDGYQDPVLMPRAVAVSLQRRAEQRATGFVAVAAATGIAKLLGGIVPLWLVFRPPLSRTARKILPLLCWAGGALLVLRAHRYRHRFDPGGPGHDGNAVWYAALWGPTWLLGGVLFLMTAWIKARQRSMG